MSFQTQSQFTLGGLDLQSDLSFIILLFFTQFSTAIEVFSASCFCWVNALAL
jgi:hypothetical protein